MLTSSGHVRHGWFDGNTLTAWIDLTTPSAATSFGAVSARPGDYSLVTRNANTLSALYFPR